MFCYKTRSDDLRQVARHSFPPHSSLPFCTYQVKTKKTVWKLKGFKNYLLFTFYYNKYLSIMELNNFKLKPTALLLGFTAAEINIKSSWKDKASGIQWQENSQVLIIWGSDGKQQHRGCKYIGKTHGCTSKTYLRFYNIPAKELKRVAKPHFRKRWGRAACQPGMGPSTFRPRSLNPGGSGRLSQKRAAWLTRSPVKGKWKVAYFKGLSWDWDELEAGKPVAPDAGEASPS